MNKPVVAVLAAAIVLAAGQARANIAAPPPDETAKIATAALNEETPLVVESEKLTFVCTKTASGPSCHFRARYEMRNPSAEPVDQIAAFIGYRTPSVTTTVNGRSAAYDLTAAQRVGMVRAYAPSDDDGSSGSAHGMRFSLQPGETATIVSEGVTKPGRAGHSGHGYTISGIKGRHLLLGGDSTDRPDTRYMFEYPIAPIHSWSHVGNIDIEVRYDDSWVLDGGLHSDRGYLEFEDVVGDGEMNVARLRTTGSDKGTVLRMAFVDEAVAIYHGGPHVGIGGAVGSGSEFRMRFGYEFGAPDFLLHSLQLDTDFDDYVVIAPTTELVSPHLLFVIPSLAVGAGVPIRVRPDTQVGVRLQGTVGFYPVAFVAALDIFPGAKKNDPHATSVTLMARFSL